MSHSFIYPDYYYQNQLTRVTLFPLLSAKYQRTLSNSKPVRISENAVMAHFKALCQHLNGRNEEKRGKALS